MAAHHHPNRRLPSGVGLGGVGLGGVGLGGVDSRNATSTPPTETETETETETSTAARVESDLTSRPSAPDVAKRSTASIARVEATQITVSRPQRDESDIAAMTPKIAAGEQAASDPLRTIVDRPSPPASRALTKRRH